MKLGKSTNKYTRDIKSAQNITLFMKLGKSINKYSREIKSAQKITLFMKLDKSIRNKNKCTDSYFISV